MTELKTWYEQLLAQVASESYLDGLANYDDGSDALIERLRLGANHYAFFDEFEDDEIGPTRMTGGEENGPHGMVDDFITTWQIIDHLPNTNSGFSATLLKHRTTGEYTLPLRSTESKDAEDGGDVERDSANGANGQIAEYGFAWAQLADLQGYFEGLQQGDLVNPGVRARHMAGRFRSAAKGHDLSHGVVG